MKNKITGFTLIEVLIALAIISIALTAVIKAASQNIKDTFYLQEKTIANWVGADIMNQARLNLIKLPLKPEKEEQEQETLGETWQWQAYLASTPNPHIREVHVLVFKQSDHPLANLVSYIYVPSS